MIVLIVQLKMVKSIKSDCGLISLFTRLINRYRHRSYMNLCGFLANGAQCDLTKYTYKTIKEISNDHFFCI